MRFGAETADYNLMPWLLGLGLMASFQQYALAQSHYYADASALAPLHYLTIPIGVGFGVLLFDEALTSKFVLGTAIILGANIYIFMRERKHERSKKNLSPSSGSFIIYHIYKMTPQSELRMKTGHLLPLALQLVYASSLYGHFGLS